MFNKAGFVACLKVPFERNDKVHYNLDTENSIIRINTAFNDYSSHKKATILPWLNEPWYDRKRTREIAQKCVSPFSHGYNFISLWCTNKKVTIVPFHEVSVEHAYKEGEGNKTLDFWREAHEKFFTECLNQVGLKFTTDMKVVCEEFSVVYK